MRNVIDTKLLCKTRDYRHVLIVLFLLVLAVLSHDVKAQPVVVTQPQDTSICVETSAEFSIVAVNTSGYQWQENDGVGWYNLDPSFTYVSGEYTPDLTIHDANLALNGYQYRCIINDAINDKDTSAPAILGVYEPPIITSHPANERVCKSDIAVFSIDDINGTSYQWLEYNGVGWLEIIDNSFYQGAQTPDLSVYTVTGMDGFLYRCIAKNVTCPDTSDLAMLNVDPTPVLFGVSGGGEYCDGGQGVSIGLNGSELGISYNLLLDGIETGVVAEGTGLALDFGFQQIAGIYTVIAYNQFTSCSIEMGGNAVVVVNPLPIDYPIQGGGTICLGDDFPDVFLLSSEIGVDYSLYRNAIYTGITRSGTGIGLNFGSQQEPGFYTIVAEDVITNCSMQMSGTAEVIIIDLPIADAGSNHTIVQGSFAQLQGNASGGSGNYNYQWSPTNLCVSPTTASTQTNTLYISTIFTLEVSDQQSGCTSHADTSIVYVNNGPLNVQAFANNNNVCMGASVSLIALAGGGTGNYSYLWTSSPPGFTSSSSTVLVAPSESTLYTITVSDGIDVVTGTISVDVFPLPNQFNINSGGSYCSGGDGIEITLDGSETGIRYSLYYQQTPIENVFGDGQQLSFGNFTQPGSYNIMATNENSGCSSTQNGVASINISELPVAEAGANNLINVGQFATLDGSATGGSGGYLYSWNPTSLLINPTSSNPSTLPLDNTTMFNLKVTDDIGCESIEDNTIVFVSGGQIALNILSSGSPVCPGNEVQLYAMASGGSGSFSYFWQSNPAGFTSTSFNPLVFPEITTTYIVMVNDGLEVITDSITIVVNLSPTEYVISGGGEVCEGDNPSNLFLNGSELGVDYQLLQDGAYTGMTISGTNYALDFGNWNTEGTYTIYAVNQTSLCDNDMNGSAVVLVSPLPISSAGPDQLINGGTSTNLAGTASGGSGSYTYRWEPSYLCVSPLSLNTSTQSISQTTLFSFVVTDAQSQCTSLSDTMFVFTQGDQLYANASASPSTICAGGELSLVATPGGGTGNYSYTWTSQPEGFYSSQQSIITYPIVSTTYFLDVFDGLSHAYDTIFITVLPAPLLFNITGGGSYCEGGTGKTIGLAGSELGASYSLFRSPDEFVNNLDGTGQALEFGIFTQSGTYYSTSSINGYCQQNMNGESEISVNQNPIPEAGDDQSILFNTQTSLSGSANLGSGDYNYQWSPSDSLINAGIQQPQTTPLHATLNYKLSVTDNVTGCNSDEDNTIVFVTGGPFTLQATSDASSVCVGESTQLFSFPSGGTGNYTYTWTSNPPGFTSTTCCPTVSPTVTTVYTVTVTDGNTTLVDDVVIFINPSPNIYTISGGGIICEGDNPSNIYLNGSELGVDYQLLHNGANTGLEISGTGFALDFGNWTDDGSYTAYALNSSSLCDDNMADMAVVTVNPLPLAMAGPDQLVPLGIETTLSGSASGVSGSYTYQWEPSYMCLSPTNPNTVTQPISQTTLFSLVVTDVQSQCVSTPDTILVFTQGDELYVSALAAPATLCAGEELSLVALAGGGTGNYSYSWTSMPSGFNSSQQSTISYPTISTTYYLDVFDGISHAFDTVIIEVLPMPSMFIITGGGNYCYGGLGTLIGLAGSETGATYSLYRNPDEYITEISGTGQSLDFGTFTQSGTYYSIASFNGYCQQAMIGESIIEVSQNPIAQAGEDQSILFNTQTYLLGDASQGSGDYSYLWLPSDSLVVPNIRQPQTVAIHNTIMYNLAVTDNVSGCISDADNTMVFVTGGPFTLQVTSDVAAICPGGETQLFSFPSGGTGNYTYSWTSSPAGFSSNTCCPTVSPTVTTIYDVSVSDGNSTLTGFVTVTVNPIPLAYSLSGGGEVCFGQQSDNIVLQNSEVNTTYSLLQDGINTGIDKIGTGFPLNFGQVSDDGQYTVFATDNITQCANYMAGEVSVITNPLPMVDAGQDVIIPAYSITTLSGNATGGSGSYSYYWQPAALCQNPQSQTTNTNSIAQTTLFIMGATDLQTQCASLNDSVFVFTTGNNLSVSASSSLASICNGELINLLALPDGGTGNYSFSWTSSPMGFVSSEINPTVQPIESTMYYVEVFDGISQATDSVYVQVLQSPYVYTITGGGSYCAGNSGVDIGLDGSEQGTLYRLFYFPDVALTDVIGTGSAFSFGTYEQVGDYFVMANANNICQEQMNGTAGILQNQLPQANAGDDIVIPWASQVMLNGSAMGGSGNYSYLWVPSDSLINPTNYEPTTVPLHNTVLFNLSVTDTETGCLGIDDNTMVFVSGGTLALEISASTESMCEGEQSQLFAIPSGGTGNYTYLWSSNPAGMTSNLANPIVTPNVTTTFFVLVSDGSNTITDSIIINVTPSPTKYTMFGGGVYCQGGDGVDVLIDGSELGINYELINDLGSTGIMLPGTGDTLNFGIQNEDGYYWAVGIAVDNGCSSFMEDTIQILSASIPIANAGFDQYINIGASAQFDGNIDGGSGFYNFNWFPEYLFVNPYVQNPVTNPLNESTLFTLVGDDANTGCMSNADTVVAYIINTELTIDVTATPLQLCENEEVSLSALPGGGTGNYSYTWYSNPQGFYSNIQFPNAYPNSSKTFIVEVSDGDTTVIDSVFVEVASLPTVYSIVGGGYFCVNDEGVNISLSGSQEQVVYTLYRNQSIEVVSIVGNGQPIDFGVFTTEGNYIVYAGNAETGCFTQMAGSVTVNQFPQPIANAGEDITIAMGANATLNGSATGGLGDYMYLWSPTEKFLNPTDPDATTVSLNETTMFSLMITDNNGCESDLSNMIVFVSGGPLSVDAIFDNNNVCPGEQVSIFALPSGGYGNYNYFWESTPAGFYATSQQIEVSPLVSTWYKVSVSDGENTISDSVFIDMLPVPESYSLLGGGGYCNGQDGVDIYLQNSSLSTIYSLYHNTLPTGQYVFGTGTQISFGNMLTEGNYYVIAQNEVGCSALMQNIVQIYLNPKPEKFQLYGGGTYCDNDPTLGVILESSEVNIDYELYKDAEPTGIVRQGSGFPLSFTGFAGTGNYSVVATYAQTGCTNPMNGVAGLIIYDKPNINISGSNSICFGESAILSASGGYNYEWNTFPVQHTPEITVAPIETTDYKLIGYNLDGCTDTASHTIEVTEMPNITAYDDPITLSVICTPDNMYNYDFYMGGVLVQNGSSNTWYYGDMGLISDTILIVAGNEAACTDEDKVFVEIKDPPNAFTPNGDGKNDLFLVGYDIIVFSSWGGEIYKGNTGWDGKYNGTMVVPGTYYYVHHIYNTNGDIIKTIKGSVTLVIE